MGGRNIKKFGMLVVLLLAAMIAVMIFVSGCAENDQENETGEEKVTPGENSASNVSVVTETARLDTDKGVVSGQEDASLIGGKAGIIKGDEKLGQNSQAFAENQTMKNNPAILQTAEGAGYTTFASLVRSAGLEATLNKGGTYTVFAPTDIAFDSLPEGMLDDLRNDKVRLKRVLTYHVVNGEYRTSDLKTTNSFISLESGELVVNSKPGGFITVESANVTEPDIIASNGVIYGIDKVLIPSEP